MYIRSLADGYAGKMTLRSLEKQLNILKDNNSSISNDKPKTMKQLHVNVNRATSYSTSLNRNDNQITASWIKNSTLLRYLRLIYDIKKQYGKGYVAILDPNALVDQYCKIMNCLKNNDTNTMKTFQFDLRFKAVNVEIAKKIFSSTVQKKYPNTIVHDLRDSQMAKEGRAAPYAQCRHLRVVDLYPDVSSA